MKTSASELIESCWRDLMDFSPPVFFDYFNSKFTDEEIGIVFGIYQGLVKYRGVDEQLLHKWFMANRLDELIHKKYNYKSSGYYELFKQKNLQIGRNNLLAGYDYSFEIYDEDHCPFCEEKGYYTNNNALNIDCEKCLKFLCKKCTYHNKNGFRNQHKSCIIEEMKNT